MISSGWAAAAAAIIVLAAALRLWHPELILFEGDESRLLRLAEDIGRLGLVPLNGPPLSAGIPSPPHYIYLLAPIAVISRDPAFVAAVIALLNVAGVAGTLYLGWRWFGPAAGCVAALLLAVNPLLVGYSRRIWQPDILAALAVLLFIALDLAIAGRRGKWAAAAFPIATLGVLVHPSFLPLTLLLVAPLALLLYARRWRYLLVGVLASVSLTIPSVIYEVEMHWQDYPNIRYYASLHTFVDLESVRLALAASTGLGLENDIAVPPASRVLPASLIDTAAVLQAALLAVAVLFSLATILRFRVHESRATRVRVAGLLVWMALPIALSIRHWLPLQVHYVFPMAPAPFLLIGYATKFRMWSVSALVAITASIQAASVALGLAQLSQAAYDPCFGRPLWYEAASEHEAVDLARRNSSGHAVIEIDGVDTPAVAYLMRADFPRIDLPISAIAYLGQPIPPGGDLPGVGPIGFGQALAARVNWGGPADAPAILTASRLLDLHSATGLALTEVAFSDQPRADQRIIVALASAYDDNAGSTAPMVWDIGLVNSDGQVLSHRPGIPQVPAEMRGEHLISWFAFDPRQEIVPAEFPSGSYMVRLQLLAGSRPVELTDSAGHSSQALELPIQMGPLARC
ncbi:MAG: DUF2029 domain-containing protein [Chloroflexi bacterium]|nr:DUF2029 domain-containing protein [Chloroflexota bacterium]